MPSSTWHHTLGPLSPYALVPSFAKARIQWDISIIGNTTGSNDPWNWPLALVSDSSGSEGVALETCSLWRGGCSCPPWSLPDKKYKVTQTRLCQIFRFWNKSQEPGLEMGNLPIITCWFCLKKKHQQLCWLTNFTYSSKFAWGCQFPSCSSHIPQEGEKVVYSSVYFSFINPPLLSINLDWCCGAFNNKGY